MKYLWDIGNLSLWRIRMYSMKQENIPVKRYEIPMGHRKFKPVENTNVFNEAGRFHSKEWN